MESLKVLPVALLVTSLFPYLLDGKTHLLLDAQPEVNKRIVENSQYSLNACWTSCVHKALLI